VKSLTPVELTSTCYYYADAVILAKAARLLGHPEDHRHYTALAAKIKQAFNEKYLNRETGIYGTGVQTAMSVPLYWGLVPDDLRGKVAARLAERVEADAFHLDVGLLGQKAILNALSENGYADVAFRIASQTTYPSWGWWIAHGATTLYENWKIDAASDVSLDHIMFGEIGAWLYKGIGGIRPDASQPGFKNVILAPHFVAGLDRFEATHRGPYGMISSSWKRVGASIEYTVIVPPNSTATVQLPLSSGATVTVNGKRLSGMSTQLRSGTYRFVIAV
jgi:alpha-L-rhamnosidase